MQVIGRAVDIGTTEKPRVIPMRLVNGSSNRWMIIVDGMGISFKEQKEFSFACACIIAGCLAHTRVNP